MEDFGIRRFTIDDVARRVGISRVTIYRHFPKKDRLVEAALLHELHRFLQDLYSAVAPYETLEERLIEGFVSALTVIRDHRLLNRLLRTEPELMCPCSPPTRHRFSAARELIANFARGGGGVELPLQRQRSTRSASYSPASCSPLC